MDIDILTEEQLVELQQQIQKQINGIAKNRRKKQNEALIGCYFLETDGKNFTAFRVDRLTMSGSLYCCYIDCCYDSDYFAVQDKICGCDGYTEIDENKWNELVDEVMSVIAQKLHGGECVIACEDTMVRNDD